MAKSGKNATSVQRVSAEGYLHRVLLKTGKLTSFLVRIFLVPIAFEFWHRWTSTRFPDERRQKAKSTDVLLLFAMLLATGSCTGGQEMGNEGLLHLARLLYFMATAHSVSARGVDPVLSRRENEVSSKVSSQRDQPTNHPSNHQTNQPVKQKTVGPRVGSKESTKAQAS
jgi:hypothetical protein